jgi:cell division protein FtsN
MTQDFAKIKPEPLLERKTVATPPAWSLMFTGMIVGLALGVFGCFLFYLSGNVPPLSENRTPISNNSVAVVNQVNTDQTTEEPAEETLQLEFYTELPAYEVPVDASPIQLSAEQAASATTSTPALVVETGESEPEQTYRPGFILQTGAFQQIELAHSESRRQRTLGLDVKVKQQQLLGRTLYLVQSGPYTSSTRLSAAEQLLRANNIPSLRMSIQ